MSARTNYQSHPSGLCGFCRGLGQPIDLKANIKKVYGPSKLTVDLKAYV